MAATAAIMCSSCFEDTRYFCLDCGLPTCNKCSVFESNEAVAGWKMGRSVAYCMYCSRQKEKKPEPEAKKEGENKPKSDDERFDKTANDEENDDDEEDDVEEEDDDNKNMPRKGKKPGRKTSWSDAAVTDLVDIIVNDSSLKRQLIFINMKNQKNTIAYQKVLKEMQRRGENRNEKINFTVAQIRGKFKRCICSCKTAALTIKTSTGIKRFQDDKGFGKWFDCLYPIVKTRDSCQPELAIEPGQPEVEKPEEPKVEAFVPKRKKRKSTESSTASHSEVLEVIKEVLKSDKETLDFMKEEMVHAREHELQLMQMMMSQQQYHYQPGNFNFNRFDQNQNTTGFF